MYMGHEDIYMDYKINYIMLKNMQNGGETQNKMIIHISGASGSGKTTLGEKIKERFHDQIVVKDIDSLRSEFIKEFYGEKKWTIIDKDEYQKYINEYINKQSKPLIFVGLNVMPWWHKNHYYDMHQTYGFYIDLDDDAILKQKCLRMFNQWAHDLPNDQMAMNDLVNNNKKFLKLVKEAIDLDCDKKETIRMNKKWKKDYMKQKYESARREEIIEKVSDILSKNRFIAVEK
jgi:adenylate kinase family enzyme